MTPACNFAGRWVTEGHFRRMLALNCRQQNMHWTPNLALRTLSTCMAHGTNLLIQRLQEHSSERVWTAGHAQGLAAHAVDRCGVHALQ